MSMTLCTSGFCCSSGSVINSSTDSDPELSKSNFLNLLPSRLISSASKLVAISICKLASFPILILTRLIRLKLYSANNVWIPSMTTNQWSASSSVHAQLGQGEKNQVWSSWLLSSFFVVDMHLSTSSRSSCLANLGLLLAAAAFRIRAGTPQRQAWQSSAFMAAMAMPSYSDFSLLSSLVKWPRDLFPGRASLFQKLRLYGFFHREKPRPPIHAATDRRRRRRHASVEKQAWPLQLAKKGGIE